MNDAEILERDLQWLAKSDIVVAEVTQPSLGVGFEIARAVTMNKPVLCLFRPSSGHSRSTAHFSCHRWSFPFADLSALIRGSANNRSFFVGNYEQREDLEKFIKDFVGYCSQKRKVWSIDRRWENGVWCFSFSNELVTRDDASDFFLGSSRLIVHFSNGFDHLLALSAIIRQKTDENSHGRSRCCRSVFFTSARSSTLWSLL